ncbi:MAG: DUF5618 family protein [Deltaproteobacteria bacterium]|nr:DUF5618 family protein [Deltaproteobacteria bacterium]
MRKEPLRYLENAKAILKKSPIENNTYTDVKYVKSACGVAYLSILEAINEVLFKKGVTKKDLPKKVEEYRKALQKYVSAHNGKMLREFDKLYDGLHIAGYYRGLIYDTAAIKDYFKATKEFIDKLH